MKGDLVEKIPEELPLHVSTTEAAQKSLGSGQIEV
jgi:hypothetical protein